MGAIALFAGRAFPQQAETPGAALLCASNAGERQTCPGDTSAGVALIKSTGAAACLLGKTWGYDNTGVWVADGCSGEFQLGHVAAAGEAAPSQPAAPKQTGTDYAPVEMWGEFDPGDGFLIGRSDHGELKVSGYALMRYINQMPGEQTFTDHVGNTRAVDGRHDIYAHRVMMFMGGWLGSPRLRYSINFWTVTTTDQDAIFAFAGYQFGRKFSLYAGMNGNPGTRSVQGSHPYWLAPDRVMADEFFRPFFGMGVWASGEVAPGLWYNTMVADSSSGLGVKATQLDRRYTTGGSMWWMPTTKEFGPRGAYGDWEMHEKVATRFGVSTVRSPEQSFRNESGAPDNTNLKLADSVNLFETGALAPGVSIDTADYRILALDAGVKYRGVFVQTEVYRRWLDAFVADGPLPVSSIVDTGFFVQGGFFPVPKKLEVYAGTSWIYGDKAANFDDSHEYQAGANYYPFNSRSYRLNFHVISVDHSPVSSTFGYYVAGQHGTTVSAAFSIFF
jgi:hypothetical protein